MKDKLFDLEDDSAFEGNLSQNLLLYPYIIHICYHIYISQMKYLGLPIGDTLKAIRRLFILHFQRQTATAYGCLVANKLRLNRELLAKLYNASALPNFLYLAPFWRTFTITETKELRRIFFWYAKYLLALPPWSSNSWVIKRYGIIDPNASIRKSIEAYNSRIGRHPWSAILIQ